MPDHITTAAHNDMIKMYVTVSTLPVVGDILPMNKSYRVIAIHTVHVNSFQVISRLKNTEWLLITS